MGVDRPAGHHSSAAACGALLHAGQSSKGAAQVVGQLPAVAALHQSDMGGWTQAGTMWVAGQEGGGPSKGRARAEQAPLTCGSQWGREQEVQHVWLQRYGTW